MTLVILTILTTAAWNVVVSDLLEVRMTGTEINQMAVKISYMLTGALIVAAIQRAGLL